MVIDTDKLREAVDAIEEKTLQEKYNGDWEHCPMSFLNASEKRVIDRKEAIREIENLTANLLAAGVWPK